MSSQATDKQSREIGIFSTLKSKAMYFNSRTKLVQNRSEYNTTTDYDSLHHFKKCDFVLKLSRGKFKKTNDRALLSQSAKVELRKQRINLILNELKK